MPRRSSAALIVLCLASPLLSAGPAGAQSVPPTAYQALHWRMIGPFRGGRVLAVSGVPGDAATFYFGAVDGGVWRTRNAGVTWEPLFDGQPVASVGALALAPGDPQVLYVGTGEADMRSDITFGAGVYRSGDGGAHWARLGLEDTRHIGKILVDPRDADVVLVAALGHAYGPNAERGVFRTTNGGRSWQKVLFKDDGTGAIDLAADPTDPNVVFATLWQARRPAWSQYPPDEGPGGGLYKSTDGGATWTALTGHGLPAGPAGRIGVAVGADRRVYALITGGERPGLYRSDDGGANWRRVGTDRRITQRGWYFGRVFVDPLNPDIVYVPDVALLRSSDGGATFTAIKGAPGGDDYHFLWIDPVRPERMIVGSDQGAVVSLDGARTWSSWYNQPTAQFYHVTTDDQFPYRIFGAQQDAGTVAITSRSDYGSITFRDWHPIGAGESGYIAPDPLDPRVIFGGDTYGAVSRFDDATGQAQDISPAPLASFGQALPERRLRFTWTSPLVFDRFDPHVLYLGAQQVLVTRNGGLRWDSLSPDLTGAVPAARSDTGPVTRANATARGWGVVYAIAPSPARAGVVWVGTDNGLVRLTTDSGATWKSVTPPDLAPWTKISQIEASPFDAGVAYLAVDRHRLDDPAPYVYRTRDAGVRWARADAGIVPNAYVRVVRADPTRAGLLYAGTETGVYVSFDDGDHWQSLQLNMPTVAVHDLAVHDGDLVAATHGRAFWVLDDLTPLEQLGDSMLGAAAFLFAPRRAVRIRRSENVDTPLPAEVPQGQNPPAGAVIDYYLASAPSAPITLEILDAGGDVVRRVASDDRPPPPPAPSQFSDNWLPPFAPLSARAGHNRFVWDLRYPPPPAAAYGFSMAATAAQGSVAEPQGPMVLPGTYQVRLTVAGLTYTQPLTIVNDPRVDVAPNVLADQLALALEIWNTMAQVHAVYAAASALASRLDSVPAGDGDTQAAVTALARRLAALARATSGADLRGLAGAVESADRAPTVQARQAFAEVRDRVTASMAEWRDIVSHGLPGLNARLARQRLPALQSAPAELSFATLTPPPAARP
jgi:photosystem II stability/assembly factor-like uncharacterized protein